MFSLASFSRAILGSAIISLPQFMQSAIAQDMPEHVTGTAPYPFTMLDVRGFEDSEAPIQLPSELI